MIENLSGSPNVLDRKAFHKAVWDREKIMSTGIGLGIAIPHVKIKEVKDITVGIGISKAGIAWEALDNKPVHAVFLIAGAEDQHDIYLRLLAKIILVLKKTERRQRLFSAANAEQVVEVFQGL
jgi:PTS system nitrogen regulatory IIA component